MNISGVPDSPLYAGTNLLLTCTFQLPSFIDDVVALSSEWRKGGEVLNTNSHINVSTVSTISRSTYRSTLQISVLSSTIDGGHYSCHSSIASSAYVLYSDASHQVSVHIQGIDLINRSYYSETPQYGPLEV